MDFNDSILHRQHYEAEDFAAFARDGFDTLHAEGGQVMCLAVHHYFMGQPHRIGQFERLLDYILAHEGVCIWNTGNSSRPRAQQNQMPRPETAIDQPP
jgi:hypothetical protein